MTNAASLLWDRVCDHLETLKVLSPGDREPLYRYCKMYDRWLRLEQFIDEHGEVYETHAYNRQATGFQIRPQMRVLIQLSEQMSKIESQFGMTPAARTRLRSERQESRSEMDRRMFGDSV